MTEQTRTAERAVQVSHYSPRPCAPRRLTRLAVSATAHCLTGCAIGEILGLVLAAWWGWSNAPSVALAVVLAFLFGYLLTIAPVLRLGLRLRRAITVVFAADTL